MRRISEWPAALRRGSSRRCPRCGRGLLFRSWTRMRERCPECDLRYLESPGDPWGFLLLLDRAVFILPPIAVIYFGWLPRSPAAIVVLFAAWAALLVYTTPHRYGACVALDWLTRSADPGRAERPDGGDGIMPARSGNGPPPRPTENRKTT